MKLLFKKFFNKDNTFLMIGFLFLFVFIGPLLFFDIPLQADDLHYYVKFISNNLPLNQFYEFQRLPVQGAIVYYSYKMLYLFSNELKANLILAFYYFFHLFSSILLYFFIKNILRLINLKHALQLNFRNVALLTSLMFLLCPIAIDSFANTSLTARNIGLPFILLSFILKISVLEKKSLLKSLYFVPASALIFLLGLSFYEPYIILFGISFLLIYLIKEYNKALVFTLFELFFISMPLVYKLFFGLNNIESRGVDMTLLNILKHLFSYIITIFSPNLHGSLFLGSFFYSICFCLLLFFHNKKL